VSLIGKYKKTVETLLHINLHKHAERERSLSR